MNNGGLCLGETQWAIPRASCVIGLGRSKRTKNAQNKKKKRDPLA